MFANFRSQSGGLRRLFKMFPSISQFSAVLIVSLMMLVAPKPALAATELITNGGFETGNFSGWTATHIFDNPGGNVWCDSWRVVTTTPCVFEPVTPPTGTYMAFNSIDGDPMTYIMYQDVTIPSGSTALFSFMYRAQWYNYNREWTQTRTMDIQIRNTSNTVLETIHHFSTGNAVCCFIHEDTQWITVSADLSAYAGQTIRLFITEDVPQVYSGGSQIYFDNFTLQAYTGSVGKINIAQSGGTTTSAEGGVSDSFTVKLSQSPASDVTVDLSTNAQCSVTNDPVILNSGNWNTGITVTVTATDDGVAEGNHVCMVTTAAATSSDAAFSTVDPINVPVTIYDNDGTRPVMTNCPPPVPTRNQAFSYTVTASGSPAPVFTRSSESFPDGITLNSSGLISGTPPNTKNYGLLITVAAENIVGYFDYIAFRPIVRPDTAALPTFLYPSVSEPQYQPLPGIVNKFYCFRFQNYGNPTPTFSLQSGTLPAGLTLSGDTISGTPTSAGTSGTITVRAVNTHGSQDISFTLTMYPAQAVPTITSGALPAAAIGVPFSHTFTATGGPPPEFGLNGAPLPAGLTYQNNTISGTPTTAGTTGIISAVARSSIGPSAAQDFTITVNTTNAPPDITSGLPPAGKVGDFYTHTFTATGTPAPTFSLTSGVLPAGLSFDDGVISGSPTGNGGVSGSITVTASNTVLPNDTQTFTITINKAPDITSSAPPAAKVGTAYTHTFTATGYPAPTFSVTSGTLPEGLDLVGSSITGTPTGTGGVSGSITVTANNGITPNDTQNFTITVNEAPTITSSPPAAAKVGTSYTHTFTATGYPAPTYSITSGTLPEGLDMVGSAITGTPTGNGGVSGSITIRASNGVTPNDTQTFTMTVNEAPDITSSAPAAAKVGTDYTHTFTATGYPAPTYSVTAGTLPAGLSLVGSTITGTPTGNGGVSGSITVTANNGITPNDTQVFTITVNAAPTITSNPPAAAKVGTSYMHLFTATGYPAPTYTVTAGTLPEGLELSGNSIIGIPTGSGGVSGSITVRASNGITPNNSQTFTITVNAPPDITSSAPAAAKVGTAYTHTFSATGYPSPTFSVTSGTLPAGLDLVNGVITGTPTGNGGVSGSITVTANNGITPNDTQTFTITVNAAPTITSNPPAAAKVGTAYTHTFTATGYPAPTYSVTAGNLPAGLIFVNGVISGTPTGTGGVSGSITVRASNGITPNNSQTFTITVNAAPIITSNAPPAGTIGAAYSHTFVATGYPAPTFSISGASLPSGLSWDGVNKIVGTPLMGVTTGTITVTATNGIAPAGTQNFTITVASAPDAAPSLNYFATATPTLRWSRITGAITYEIQVSRNLGFTDIVDEEINIPAATMTYTVNPALGDGVYYWRVRVVKANGTSAWSAKQQITVNG